MKPWYKELPLYPNNENFVLFMRRIEMHTYSIANRSLWAPCDSLLIASFLYPDIIVKSKRSSVKIDLNYNSTNPRGLLIEAQPESSGAEHIIIEKIDNEKFKELIVRSISN